MPELPGVITVERCLDAFSPCRTERLDRTYAAYADGVVYLVISYENPKRRQSLEEIINESLSPVRGDYDVASETNITLNKFKGRKYVLTSNKGGYNRALAFYLTGEHVYEIQAVGEQTDAPAVQKFLKSFTLSRKPKGKDIGIGARLRAGESLAATATSPAPAATKNKAQDTQTPGVLRPSEVTRKAVIILKPSPAYTEEARQNTITGTVVLQAVLSSSGTVTNIRAVSGLSHGLTEKAIGAIRQIYFIPAVKDGKHVSQYIRVEYNFNIY